MKRVYYTPKNSTETKSYLIDDIDANEAVRKFPDEYSFSPPTGPIVEVKTPQSAMAAGEPLPVSAIAGDDATKEVGPTASGTTEAAPAAASETSGAAAKT